MRTRTPKEAQIVVVDYRRSLLGEVSDEYLLNYLTSATQATPTLKDIAAYLESRIPGPDVTPEQLRNRSWWTGAEVFVVVDDYDLVATQQSSPVQALQPLMAQARDTGLHLVVARRVGGASRASYEPVLQSMRDLAHARRAALRSARRGRPHRQPAAAARTARPRPRRHPRQGHRGRAAGVDRPDDVMVRVYVDMVGDLFHPGPRRAAARSPRAR